MGSTRTVNQERALAWWLKEHPGYKPQLAVPGTLVIKKGDDVIEHTTAMVEILYNRSREEEKQQKKQMRKAIGQKVTPRRKRTVKAQQSDLFGEVP